MLRQVLLLLTTTIMACLAQDRLGFVFELIRHGARAPCWEDPRFPIPTGMLSPQGMRQRYLIGKLNRAKYIEEY
jgi:hypothetical protein